MNNWEKEFDELEFDIKTHEIDTAGERQIEGIKFCKGGEAESFKVLTYLCLDKIKPQIKSFIKKTLKEQRESFIEMLGEEQMQLSGDPIVNHETAGRNSLRKELRDKLK